MSRSGLRVIGRTVLLGAVAATSWLAGVQDAVAQGRARGDVKDEWGNAIPGASVTAAPTSGAAPQTVKTENNGRYQLLLGSGDYDFTAMAEGYQGVRVRANVQQTGENRPINFELPVVPKGGRFKGKATFVAEGTARPSFTFTEDGKFTFEDDQGKGEGTYDIVGVNAELVVRKYGGPKGKFSIATLVTIVFSSNTYVDGTLEGQKLIKK